MIMGCFRPLFLFGFLLLYLVLLLLLPHLGRFCQTLLHCCSTTGGALWARIAQNVKKPSPTVNVIDFEFFGFYVSVWVPWSPLGPKKL